jgi:hypothetical protein
MMTRSSSAIHLCFHGQNLQKPMANCIHHHRDVNVIQLQYVLLSEILAYPTQLTQLTPKIPWFIIIPHYKHSHFMAFLFGDFYGALLSRSPSRLRDIKDTWIEKA